MVDDTLRIGCPQCGKPMKDEKTKFTCSFCGFVRDWNLEQLREKKE